MRSLASRIALVTVALVALAVLLAVGGAWTIGQRIADRAVTDSLSASQSIQRYLQQSTAREVALTSDLVAADPHFTAYLVEAIRGGLDGPEEIDLRSILDQVDERRREMGLDFAMMLDPDGQVLVRTDRPQAGRESRATHPLVAAAKAELTPEYGPWREGSRLYNAAVVPVTTAFEVVGFLVSGLAIDNDVAADIKRVTGVDVVFLGLGERDLAVVASTLDLRRNERLLAQLSEAVGGRLRAGDAVDRIDLAFDGEKWVARAEPIVDAAGDVLAAALTIDSLDARMAGHRAIQTTLAVAGLLAVLVALLLSVWMARRIARPVSALAEIADQAAQGDYQQLIDIERRDEVGLLARAVSRLLADLREQQEIAGYVTDVSTQLGESTVDAEATDPGPPTAAISSARTATAALIGLQWDSEDGVDEARLIDLMALAGRAGAALVPGENRRYYLVFDESKRAGLATALAELLKRYASAEPAPALGLAYGPLSSRRLAMGETVAPQLAGQALKHCIRLVEEAAPGRLLVSPAAHRLLTESLALAPAAFGVAEGQRSGRRFHQLLGVDATDPDATLALPQRPVPARPRQPLPQPGAVLGDRYEILARLGAGAMGEVYRARDRKLDDIVALKMLSPELAADEADIERMKSEIRLARRITHPNVLRTHDWVEIDGRPFISMEYVRGISLHQLLKRSGRLNLAAGLRVCRQVLQGLEAAHAAGILHRDIKPANIILDQRGNARLMDFGIARQLSRDDQALTRPGTLVGTANYMAPEVILGEPADERSDIYAVGVMMNEIFTGELPLKGDTSVQVCMAHVQSEPTPPSAIWPDIPPDLEAIILNCLAKDPANRYTDVSALLARLIQIRRQSAAATASG